MILAPWFLPKVWHLILWSKERFVSLAIQCPLFLCCIWTLGNYIDYFFHSFILKLYQFKRLGSLLLYWTLKILLLEKKRRRKPNLNLGNESNQNLIFFKFCEHRVTQTLVIKPRPNVKLLTRDGVGCHGSLVQLIGLEL